MLGVLPGRVAAREQQMALAGAGVPESATLLNTDATRSTFDPSAAPCVERVAKQVTKPIRNREARVTVPHVA
jgi:hypothetical protein